MLLYNPEIRNILERRVREQELEGYYCGGFSPDKTKFFAYTYVPFSSLDIDDYHYTLNSASHSTIGADIEKRKTWLDENTYQMKTAEECIKQGIYIAFSFKFFGAYYEDEWYILTELIYWGEQIPEERAKAILSHHDTHPQRWTMSPFEQEWRSSLGNIPLRHIDMEEFAGSPWLVAYIKAERKTRVNSAFTKFMNASVVEPFFRHIRTAYFEEYAEFNSLFGEDHTLIFPEDKAYFLVVTMALHKTKGYRLVWFLYDPKPARFYRWTFPQPRYNDWSYAYAEDVIMDIKDISNWDDIGFLKSSLTMDNQQFWTEYVFKKENDRYVWLSQIT